VAVHLVDYFPRAGAGVEQGTQHPALRHIVAKRGNRQGWQEPAGRISAGVGRFGFRMVWHLRIVAESAAPAPSSFCLLSDRVILPARMPRAPGRGYEMPESPGRTAVLVDSARPASALVGGSETLFRGSLRQKYESLKFAAPWKASKTRQEGSLRPIGKPCFRVMRAILVRRYALARCARYVGLRIDGRRPLRSSQGPQGSSRPEPEGPSTSL